MARRSTPKVTSVAAQVKAVQASFLIIKPPAHIEIDETDMIFFNNVIAEFAKSEWTEHQLELAAMLARTLADVNREQAALRIEGYCIERGNGTTVENPRLRVVKALTGDILSFRRSLSLHARARGGEPRDTGKKREMLKNMESGSDFDDDLIARPH